MSKSKGKPSAKAKTTAKKAAVKKVEAKAEAVEVSSAVPVKGDIVRAYNKNFLVDSVNKGKKTVRATHLHTVECRITGDMSRVIPMADIHTTWHKAK